MAYIAEQEIFERFEYYTMQVEALLLQGEDFESVAERIPCMLQLSDSEDFKILKLNDAAIEVTGFTTEEIRENWEEYIKIVHPKTKEALGSFLPEFYETQTSHQTTAFVQYVKLYGKSDFEPVITFTKPSKLPNGRLIWLSVLPEQMEKSQKRIEHVIRMDEFKMKHFKKFQKLTSREVEILKLLANGCNNPDIAKGLFISRSTVETHRKNLKRKLNLQSFCDLMRYAFAFNLVEV